MYAYAKGTSTVVSSCPSTAAAHGCLINGLTSNTEYDVAVRGFFTLTGSADVRPTFDSTSSEWNPGSSFRVRFFANQPEVLSDRGSISERPQQ